MEKLYNQEIKEKFLSTYENEQTQNTIRRVFYKSELIESVLEKDLYAFNLTEIGKVISNANPYSASVARSLGRFISQYISWAVSYRNSNLNPLQGVTQEWFDQFVDKTKKIHYSYEEFTELIEDPALINAQDQALLFLLFEGVKGESFIELRSLEYENINFVENEIYIANRDDYVEVSDECLKYLQKAYEQKTYYTYNNGDYKEKELLDSPYLFKNVKSGRTESGNMVSMAVIYNRLNSIKTDLLELEYLTPNAVSQSGQIFHSVLLYKEYGKLEYEQFEIIGRKYNLSMITNNGYTYYNSFLMREYINPENIKNLYGINIEF
jgi:integrase